MSSLKIVAEALRAEATALAYLGDDAPIRGILERVADRLEAHDARIEGIAIEGIVPKGLGESAEENLDRPTNIERPPGEWVAPGIYRPTNPKGPGAREVPD